MLKNYLILLTMLMSGLFAVFDFFLFKLSPKIAFYIHNVVALFVGIGLMYLSYILIKNKLKNQHFNYFIFVVGCVMIVVHISKLIIGNCI